MNSQQQTEHFILFGLAGTTYAVRSTDVRQMDMIGQITPVPNAPQCVDGVVFLRGQVLPAINLRVRFGFPRIDYDIKARLIVVQSGGRSVGLIVDTAREFVAIPRDAIQPPPEGISNLSGKYLDGIVKIGDRVILVLNVEEVINPLDSQTIVEKGP